MSAFIVPEDHIIELVAFAVSNRPGGHYGRRVNPAYLYEGSQPPLSTDLEITQWYVDLLQEANVESVTHLYEGRYDLPAPIILTRVPNKHERTKPVDILKMCHCLEYQSCEHPGWKDSQAKRLLGMIEKAAIVELPGYDDAQWSYIRPTSWQDLRVTNSDGEDIGRLRDVVRRSDAALDHVTIKGGKVVSWHQHFISKPGEEPGYNTPYGPVDWTGFENSVEIFRQPATA